MKTINRILLTAVALLAMGIPSFAQATVPTTTFLTAAVTNTTRTITVSSTTNFTGVGRALYIDRELMNITGVDTATGIITVSRGVAGIQSAHLVNSIVFVGPGGGSGPFSASGGTTNYPAPGPCVRSGIIYSTMINTTTGDVWTCDLVYRGTGVTGNGVLTATPYNWQLAIRGGIYEDQQYYTAVNAAYTARSYDYFIDYVSMTASRTLTLPPVTTTFGKKMIIKNSADTQTLTIAGGVGQWITTYLTFSTTLGPGGILRLISAGGGWETW